MRKQSTLRSTRSLPAPSTLAAATTIAPGTWPAHRLWPLLVTTRISTAQFIMALVRLLKIIARLASTSTPLAPRMLLPQEVASTNILVMEPRTTTPRLHLLVLILLQTRRTCLGHGHRQSPRPTGPRHRSATPTAVLTTDTLSKSLMRQVSAPPQRSLLHSLLVQSLNSLILLS